MRRRSFAPGAFYNGAGVRCCHVNQVPAIYQTRFISPHVRLICYVRPRFTHRRRRRRPHEEDACISFKVDYAPLCIELHNCFPRSCNSLKQMVYIFFISSYYITLYLPNFSEISYLFTLSKAFCIFMK